LRSTEPVPEQRKKKERNDDQKITFYSGYRLLVQNKPAVLFIYFIFMYIRRRYYLTLGYFIYFRDFGKIFGTVDHRECCEQLSIQL